MSKKRYEVGSGNVFKDLGIPNAEEHLVKAQLVFKIESIMKSRRLKQAEAAELLGRVRDIRRPGAASLELCSVAAGWTDAYVEHGLARWDWAAGALIASEAGAVVSLPGEDEALGVDATFAAARSRISPSMTCSTGPPNNSRMARSLRTMRCPRAGTIATRMSTPERFTMRRNLQAVRTS